MSYPRDLADYRDGELRIELERRSVSRADGLCDYCRRSPNEPPCRYPDRHWLAAGKSKIRSAPGGEP